MGTAAKAVLRLLRLRRRQWLRKWHSTRGLCYLEPLRRAADQVGLFGTVLGNHREGAVAEPFSGKCRRLALLEYLDRLNDVLVIDICVSTKLTTADGAIGTNSAEINFGLG